METKKGFFMVYLQGRRTPTYCHESMESAEREAKRLAMEYGNTAYVLATVKSVVHDAWKVSDCYPEGVDLPF